MKILIVSYFYYPENTPRAFRAHELVKIFSKKGWKITLVLPNKEIYKHCKYPDNVTVKYVGNEQKNGTKKQLRNLFLKRLKNVLFNAKYYFMPFSFFGNFVENAKEELCKINTTFDIVISNSFPFVTHLALYKAFKLNESLNKSKLKIAEFSDPFTRQKHKKVLPLYTLLEKRVLNYFNIISIPIESARNSYLQYKDKKNIVVLPQAYDLTQYKNEKNKHNSIPHFAYAGMFYKGLRDPSFLFEYLIKTTSEFKFVIYTRFPDDEFILKYKEKLKEKLEIRVDVPREKLINELATMDFLINIDNQSSNQIPSKIIDYSLANRPIFSASHQTFKEEILNQFLAGDFTHSLKIDMSNHNIENVYNKILNLYHEVS